MRAIILCRPSYGSALGPRHLPARGHGFVAPRSLLPDGVNERTHAEARSQPKERTIVSKRLPTSLYDGADTCRW
jgi:hypothetical protein